jgi:hypothetical protein
VKKNICLALEEITPANGYLFDLTGKVFRGRVLFGAKDPLPMLALLETPLQPDQLPTARDSVLSAGRWELTVQGFLDDDFENPTDPGDALAADVIRRLVVEKEKLGGRYGDPNLFNMGVDVTDLIIGVPVSRPPDELSAKAYFYLPISLGLAEDLDKPYGNMKP